MIDFLVKIRSSAQGFIFINPPLNYKAISSGSNTLFLWGDPILPDNTPENELSDLDISILLSIVKGHFYFLKINPEANNLSAGVSMFNILPLYFHETKEDIFLSSTPQQIASQLPAVTINNRFILENILFNYQIFNQTCFKEIRLLPTNYFLNIHNNKISIINHTSIENLFVANPIPWRKSTFKMAELFIDSSKHYFPNEPYVTSLTGGFDGRTLVSCGLHFDKHFSTYSFGKSESSDVRIAQILSNKADLNYERIELDDSYVKNDSLQNGLEFIKGAAGGAGFARAHYLFASKQLSKSYKTIISGNFGSEVFRAAHIAGAVISPNLYKLFLAKDFDEAIAFISTSQEFKFLNRKSFNREWEELLEDLKTLPCFDPKFKSLKKNEQFYIILFEETLRKYFGAEMTNQFKYLVNRTPFLDFDFLKGILQTEMAGVYSDFFTHNPFKRFKGQVLYAHIIQKTHPEFSNEMTDKGYRPKDLVSIPGNLKIVQSYLKKKLWNNSHSEPDPYAVNTAFKNNLSFWQNQAIDDELFSKEFIRNSFQNQTNFTASFYIALSQIWWTNFLKNSGK